MTDTEEDGSEVLYQSLSIAGSLEQEKQFRGMQFCRLACRLIPFACEWFCFPVAAGLFQFHLPLSVPTATFDCSYCVSGPIEFRNLPYSSRLIVWRDGRHKAMCKLEFMCLRLDLG